MTPIFSLDNMYRQYLHCRRNKRNTLNALKFEYNLEENLVRLQEELKERTYSPSRSVCFVVNQPKLREIFAADFKDRVVHHVLVSALEKVWEPCFIYDSYACRKEKGTHLSVRRLQAFTRKVSRNNTRRAYFMHLDIQGFFFNINKEILYQVITKKIKDEDVRWLAKTIIFHDCTKNFIYKGKRHLLKEVPPHKTLFNAENERGLPIGNLTSQFFANVYLNELDQFVKHHLKASYYMRYCDDFVLLDERKERLLEWKEKIREFLNVKLRLCLNDKRQAIGPIRNGVDFLGYIVRPDYLLVRRRVVNRLKARLIEYQKKLIVEKPVLIKHVLAKAGMGKVSHSPYQVRGRVLKYDISVMEKLRDTWSSYMAHFKMANAYLLKKRLSERFSWIGDLYYHEKDRLKIVNRAPSRLHTLKGQYRFFLGRYPKAILFFQVGRFFEFYDKQAEIVQEVLGLKGTGSTRGFRARCGFPVSSKERYLRWFMEQGFTVRVIREGGVWLSGVKKRSIAERWTSISARSFKAMSLR